MGTKLTRWFCAQIGAREHYAVPRVLHQQKQLAALYTDFWAGKATRHLLQFLPVQAARSLSARFHPELDSAPVLSWNLSALAWERSLRRPKNRQPNGGVYLGYLDIGSRFAMLVREQLKREATLQSPAVFFAYDTGALESLEWCRENEIPCVVNQMDPARVEFDLVREEEQRWPDWKPQPLIVPEAYCQRREQEWAAADRIVVNSRWSSDALAQQGVPKEKIAIIPLCYEAPARTATKNNQRPAGAPLRVLFLGQVILRKGIQYLFQAARLLEKENIRFDIVGPSDIPPHILQTAPGNLHFHGRATRDQAAAWYQQSNVFVLPTLSDGFALTQLEAMAHGLPVVTTPCCGEVVSDGHDGFIVPPRDAAALAKAFQKHLTEPGLLAAQSAAALVKAGQFTPARLAENLQRLEKSLNEQTPFACV
jgi:glycosyltransferase involved in cell wall biosynthesis